MLKSRQKPHFWFQAEVWLDCFQLSALLLSQSPWLLEYWWIESENPDLERRKWRLYSLPKTCLRKTKNSRSNGILKKHKSSLNTQKSEICAEAADRCVCEEGHECCGSDVHITTASEYCVNKRAHEAAVKPILRWQTGDNCVSNPLWYKSESDGNASNNVEGKFWSVVLWEPLENRESSLYGSNWAEIGSCPH